MANSSVVSGGAHLVGSAPVESAEEMFQLSIKHLGKHIKRMPDGEFGERDTWIRFQHARLLSSPQLKSSEEVGKYVPFSPIICEENINSAKQIELPKLGYADSAVSSYKVFKELKTKGVIPSYVRFQVGLPTPYSVATFYGHVSIQNILEEAYSDSIKLELAMILQAIPYKELAIQWEVVSEFAVLEGVIPSHVNEDVLGYQTKRVGELVNSLPKDVEAGIHLCYGDSGHKHFCEPKDTQYLSDFANGIVCLSDRKIDWLHLPVPKERDDEEYFKPLDSLDLEEETVLYLGLVHETGGIVGTRRRIDAARSFVKEFGIATECGLGRRQSKNLPNLLDQHRSLIEEER
ncbi:MAG: hypothetical protein VX617_04915 [Pseudomonadota bacterium]|nr:hypothetical protein [Pseudomonadota bacterium]